MDPVSLANAITTFLVPQLTNIGGKILEDLGKAAWDLIMETFQDKPASVSTAQEFESNAEDPDNQAAFEAQLRKALKENPEFAGKLEELLNEAEKSGITNTKGAVANENSNAISIEGDSSGTIIIGNDNSVSQSGAKLIRRKTR
ncbi:MAG: hypothetical protein IT312_13745 [Anaerolineales bacterium]|nr:hypothetical protein [Anaerolineales bacterium]